MDPAENRLLRKIFIKGSVTEAFRKIHPPPILREPFKVLECLLVFSYQLYNNLDSCGEYSLRTGIKSLSFIPQFAIVYAPI
jgi:hypothetical protein